MSTTMIVKVALVPVTSLVTYEMTAVQIYKRLVAFVSILKLVFLICTYMHSVSINFSTICSS